MKKGDLLGGLKVVDVKRVNKMNLIQFTKAVSEYIEKGYKLDVNSSRQIGLVLQTDMYKLEDSSSIGSVEIKEELKQPNETTIEALQEPTENLDTVETFDEVVKEVTEQPVETETTVKKTTRAKKTT